MVTIAIVDDHKIFRNGMRLLINKIPGVKLICEASNGFDFLEMEEHLAELSLVFMDINMPVMNGMQTTVEIKKRYPLIKVIALTSYEDNQHLNQMLEAGADGYIVKSAEPEEFARAIEKVRTGKPYFSDEVLAGMANRMVNRPIRLPQVPTLTIREKEILKLLCTGLSNQKIGEQLHISDRTVERHKTNLLLKTGTENTLNLVIFALKNKMVEI